MSFKFSDQHIEDYHTLGCAVFRRVLPAGLIRDLRRVTDQARDIARETKGGQAQRLQPVSRHDLDQQPFIDYAELPELNEAIARVLSPRHRHGDLDILGVLLEPGDLAYCTAWHRDWRDNIPGFPLEMWEPAYTDINLFNQVNCALYEDSCTWFVPGSHLRQDLPRERERFPTRPVERPILDDQPAEERERLCLLYCESMPGAVQMHLGAGDFALYRSTLWHIGNYVPYRKRATLHDSVMTVEFQAFKEEAMEVIKRNRAAG